MIHLNDSLYGDLIPWREQSPAEVEKEHRRAEVERARTAATDAIIMASIDVVQVLHEALMHDDPQVRLRACEILLSRSIAKVAAKHVLNADENTQDTVDVAALRESILEEVKKKR